MREFRNGIAIVSMVLDMKERVPYGEAETWSCISLRLKP